MGKICGSIIFPKIEDNNYIPTKLDGIVKYVVTKLDT